MRHLRWLMLGCLSAGWAGAAQGATPQELLESARAAVATGERKAGATAEDGLLVAVGIAPVATFGNAHRSGLRAEEKAELAAFGELRAWALTQTNADLGGPSTTEAVRAYLATVAGDVEIRDVLAKQNFNDGKSAYSILVVGADTVGTADVRNPAFRSGFEEYLRTDPKVGEVAYEFLGPENAQSERLFLRQLEAEGLSVAPFRDPWSALDRELKRLAGEKPEAVQRETAVNRTKQAAERLAAKDLDGARALYLRALSVEPLLASANAGLAEVYLQKKMPRLALRFAELGFCSEGSRRELYETLGRALEANDRKAEAQLAKGLAGKTEGSALVVTEMSQNYEEMLRAKLWRSALLLRCDARLPLNELRSRWNRKEDVARRLLEQGRAAFGKSTDTREALGLFMQSLDADPFQAETLNYVAACLRSQKNFAGTRVFAAMASRLDPKNAAAYVNQAIALEELGAPALALKELQTAQALKPQDSWSQRKIAEGLERLSQAAAEGEKP